MTIDNINQQFPCVVYVRKLPPLVPDRPAWQQLFNDRIDLLSHLVPDKPFPPIKLKRPGIKTCLKQAWQSARKATRDKLLRKYNPRSVKVHLHNINTYMITESYANTPDVPVAVVELTGDYATRVQGMVTHWSTLVTSDIRRGTPRLVGTPFPLLRQRFKTCYTDYRTNFACGFQLRRAFRRMIPHIGPEDVRLTQHHLYPVADQKLLEDLRLRVSPFYDFVEVYTSDCAAGLASTLAGMCAHASERLERAITRTSDGLGAGVTKAIIDNALAATVFKHCSLDQVVDKYNALEKQRVKLQKLADLIESQQASEQVADAFLNPFG